MRAKVPMRVAIYARVSTRDKGQDTDNQVHQLREYCARQGWTIVAEYTDQASGKTSDREALGKLFAAASRREFDRLVVWALDRLSREGVLQTFAHVERLRSWGVELESYTEAHFRTAGPAGELMLAIAAWIAKQERVRLSERTKAGLARAYRAGKRCGRPTRIFDHARAAELRAQGLSMRAVARMMSIPETTLRESLDGARKRVDHRRKSAVANTAFA
jgi:DNA invertase Pin-like site-specific DNA recombinase